MSSFEQTKGEIVGSAFGQALSLTADDAWTQIVEQIKSVANCGTLNWSAKNTTYEIPAGYYSGGTLDSRPSYNAAMSSYGVTFKCACLATAWSLGQYASDKANSRNVNVGTNRRGFIVIFAQRVSTDLAQSDYKVSGLNTLGLIGTVNLLTEQYAYYELRIYSFKTTTAQTLTVAYTGSSRGLTNMSIFALY